MIDCHWCDWLSLGVLLNAIGCVVGYCWIVGSLDVGVYGNRCIVLWKGSIVSGSGRIVCVEGQDIVLLKWQDCPSVENKTKQK